MRDNDEENFRLRFEEYCQDLLLNKSQTNKGKDKIYYCKYTPVGIPIFNLLSHDKLQISCLCNRAEQLSFEQAFNIFVDDLCPYLDLQDYYYCPTVGHEHSQFKYYCKICKKNICDLCLNKFKICSHKNSTHLFNFDEYYDDYIQIGESILDKLYNLNVEPYALKLFDVIFTNFKKYKYNYSYYYIINKYSELLANNKLLKKNQ